MLLETISTFGEFMFKISTVLIQIKIEKIFFFCKMLHRRIRTWRLFAGLDLDVTMVTVWHGSTNRRQISTTPNAVEALNLKGD